MILTMTTGAEFDEINRKYSKHPERFEMWCGFDFAGYNNTGFEASAVKELERCHQAGARGVGEIHDKGKGLRSGKSNAAGMHPDDARMDALFEKCGDRQKLRRCHHALAAAAMESHLEHECALALAMRIKSRQDRQC